MRWILSLLIASFLLPVAVGQAGNTLCHPRGTTD